MEALRTGQLAWVSTPPRSHQECPTALPVTTARAFLHAATGPTATVVAVRTPPAGFSTSLSASWGILRAFGKDYFPPEGQLILF